MYDLEQQEDENSYKKVSKNEVDKARKFCEDNKLIFTGFIDYSSNKEQKWVFINKCLNKIAGKEIKKIKAKRKRKEKKRKREEEKRKREEEEKK